ncbi:MAG: flagellar hook basal-body protein [Acidobacteria bacterium]|nr:flagellar hook basal-body protein [Acidobacteriota bacterium]
MDPLTTAAAAGMRARLEALDLLANNLANSSTPGFKADREAYSIYLGAESQEAAASGLGLATGAVPEIDSHRTDFRPGVLTSTGSAQDLALSGEGFFLVDGPNGPLLTRGGTFRVSADGRVTTSEGYEFATVEPRRIRADSTKAVEVDLDGTVRQEGVALGRFKLVRPDLKNQPAKREGVYFSIDNSQVAGMPESQAEVRQGMSEASNYSAPEAAVRLVSVLRQFESLQRAMQMSSEMGRKAVEEVARVNG